MKPLRVGTDCSGIDAPIQALINLKIPFTHVFSSEIDEHCVQSIRANYNPKIIYTDITQRDPRSVPNIDLYVCGFPCQPFSKAGRQLGVHDERSHVVFHCLELIRIKRPKYFILENVKQVLTTDGGRLFRTILDILSDLHSYNIYWNVLNTKDYGIPQNRERLYIVGSRNNKKEFIWPSPTKCRPLSTFIDYSNTVRDTLPDYVKKHGTLKRIPRNSIFINLDYPKDSFPNSDTICPCILCGGNMWCVPLHRKLTIKEYLSLQGFPINFVQVVSDTQLKRQIGNSMSVCVLEAIFKELI